MNFGLLLSQFPHVEESRAQYNEMLALRASAPYGFAAFWLRLKNFVS